MSPHPLRRFVPRTVRLGSKMRRKNGRWRMALPDRVFLEDVAVPDFIAMPDVRRVLDIGIAWYTRSYPKLFAGMEYSSIDIDPAQERFGGPNHQTASVLDLATLFPAESFDLVVCNGVVGWGLRTPADAARGLAACADVLRPGGWLVLGWNDTPTTRVEGLEGILAERFERRALPAIGADHFVPETTYGHRFDFLVRK